MRDSPELRIRYLNGDARLPQRATEGASGFDLYACLPGKQGLGVGRDVVLVPTGIACEVPPGFDAQIRPRSGLARRGVNVILGTLDSDYRGEVLVAMHTFGSLERYDVNHGDRIAQLVITKIADLRLVEVAELGDTERGEGGHGSTGR